MGGELADQPRLGGEIGQKESEKGRENAEEKKRGHDDEKPGENVFEKQQQTTGGRDACREDTFNFKVFWIGEIVLGKRGDDDWRDNQEDNPADNEYCAARYERRLR